MIKKPYILILLIAFIFSAEMNTMDFAPDLSKKSTRYEHLLNKACQADENADSILHYCRLALPLASNKIERAAVFELIGKGYIINDYPDSGFYYLNDARKIYLEEKNTNGLARLYVNFGKAFSIYDNHAESKIYYLKALHLKSEELTVNNKLLNVYYSLANSDYVLGNYSSAHTYLDYIEAEYVSKIKKNYLYYNAQILRSKIYAEEGKVQQALDAAEKTIDLIGHIKEKKEQSLLYSEIYHHQGIVYYYMNELDKASDVYEKGMKIATSAEDSLEFGKNLLAFYILNGENKKATHLANTLIRHSQHKAALFVIFANYSEALYNLDSIDKAKEVYYRAKNIIDSTGAYYLIADLNATMKTINKDESLEMYKEINGYIPWLVAKTRDYNTENKSNGAKLLQTIQIADTEIALRDERIQNRNQLILVISIALLLLLIATFIITQKHRKVKALNKSLQDSYNLLTGEINMELRVIVQKVFDLDRDLNKLLPVKIEFENHFEELINKIKHLLKLLNNK